MFARAAYGTIGSNLPALMRAIVACGWFGIQAWIGGEALHTFFSTHRARMERAARRGFGGHTDDRMAVVPAVLEPECLRSSIAAWICCGGSRTGPRRSCS